jgi:hypothetical protein
MTKSLKKISEEESSVHQENQPAVPQEPLETSAPESQTGAPKPSREELFAEIRQSLKEEDETKAKKPGFGERLKGWFRRSSKKKAEVLVTETADALEIPESRSAVGAASAEIESMPAIPPELESLSSLAVEKEKEEMPAPAEKIEPPSAQENVQEREPFKVEEESKAEDVPEARITSRELLSKAREGEEAEGKYTEIRDVALQEYGETSVEPTAEEPFSLRKSMRHAWRDLRPLEKRILLGAAILIVVFLMFAGGYFVFSSLPARPAPTATPTASNEPFPLSISLPGGWTFPLNRGYVVNGKWNPLGPEWLQGTDVCRWVALPYSVQLEAVLRTLKLDDQIGLTMSNYDYLVFKTKSIQQVPVDQVNQLDSQTPCLLVILANDKSDTRWVVAATP